MTAAPQAQVYRAVSNVSAALASEGIGKTRKNVQQGYAFRGIDDVMNALAPLLVEHGVLIVPRMFSRECDERQTKSGGAMFSVVVGAEFDFISVADGSAFTARTYGEAMDTGDKATNKAMAVAYKYAAFQTFCIPTEGGGDTDADAVTHEEVAPKSKRDTRADFTLLQAALRAAVKHGPEQFKAVWVEWQPRLADWPKDWKRDITAEKDRLKAELEQVADA